MCDLNHQNISKTNWYNTSHNLNNCKHNITQKLLTFRPQMHIINMYLGCNLCMYKKYPGHKFNIEL